MAQNTTLPHIQQALLGETKLCDRAWYNFFDYLSFRQKRTFQQVTPFSTADNMGQVGDSAFDDNYLYIKTSIGWRRIALTSF